jgi:hypothetical protein
MGVSFELMMNTRPGDARAAATIEAAEARAGRASTRPPRPTSPRLSGSGSER